VTAAQQNLLTLIDAADVALATSQTAAATASTDCASFSAATLPAAGDPTDPAYDAAAEAAALAAALAVAQGQLTTCQASVTAAGTAQIATSSAQAAVSAAMTTLDDAIAQLQTALAAGSASGGSTPAASTSTPSASGPTVASASAADIVADRAKIAAAQAQVAIATQQLSGATLTSPIGGTVAQIAFAAGDSVSAGSSTAVISVIGDDGYLIESTVALAKVTKVEASQKATVTISSSGATYDAEVSAVGIVNVSETSSPAYAVTIAVDAGGDTLLNGAAATADIAVASGDSVLTVPLSAVHSSGGGGYTVDVLANGAVTTTPVEVGAIGSEAVEITSGLAAGDVLVLADLSEEIATSDSSTSSGGLTGLSGGDGGDFTGGPPTGFVRPNG
jgi:HlyD family secretion protein